MVAGGWSKASLWRPRARDVNEMRGEPRECLGNSFLSRNKTRIKNSKMCKMSKSLACSKTARRIFCFWKSGVSENVSQMTNPCSPGTYITP